MFIDFVVVWVVIKVISGILSVVCFDIFIRFYYILIEWSDEISEKSCYEKGIYFCELGDGWIC